MKIYILGASMSQQGALYNQIRIFIPGKGVVIYEVQNIRYKNGQQKFIGFSDGPKTLEEATSASNYYIEIIKEEDVSKNTISELVRAYRDVQRAQDKSKKIIEKFFNEVI